jgi:hypothetical protein
MKKIEGPRKKRPGAHTLTPVGTSCVHNFWPTPTVQGIVGAPKAHIVSLQWRSYGLRDDVYLRLKVLTCMLDPI